MSINILLVEDDASLGGMLQESLQSLYQVYWAKNIAEAIVVLENNIDLIVCDVHFQGEPHGFTLLQQIKQRYPQIPCLMMTAYASVEQAVTAIKIGAEDYLVKPFLAKTLQDKIKDLLNKHHSATMLDKDLVCNSKVMQDVFATAKKVSNNLMSVLLYGESGSGKEIVAKYIHRQSQRTGDFVAINCAAIPDNMLEALLFGYERGAFTGAYQAQAGKFELAQKGTLLLDEVAELPLTLQAKLLRVLQEREVERLGGKKTITLNVRFLAASNKNLQELVKQGVFREDLYYRLSVFPLEVPPLRQRNSDIIPLAQYFVAKYCKLQQRTIPQLRECCVDKLTAYTYPGNIRELDNIIQRALVLSSGQYLQAEHILLDKQHLRIES